MIVNLIGQVSVMLQRMKGRTGACGRGVCRSHDGNGIGRIWRKLMSGLMREKCLINGAVQLLGSFVISRLVHK